MQMPKGALPDSEWDIRLRRLAKGHSLGKGEAPRPGTIHYDRYRAIICCPLTHKAPGQRTLFGAPAACTCTYHISTVRSHNESLVPYYCCKFHNCQ